MPLLALAACSGVSTEAPAAADEGAASSDGTTESTTSVSDALDVSTSPDQDRIRTTESAEAVALLPDAWKDKDELVVAISAGAAPPLGFLADDDETPIGNETDIAQLVADALGKDLRLEVKAWADWPLALGSGDVDAVISNVTVTEERKETIDFSTYRNDELGWLVGADSDITSITKREDIAGKVVAVGSGTNQEKIVLEWDRLNQEDGLEPVQGPEYYEQFSDVLLALQSGRIETYVGPNASLAYQAAISPQDFKVVGTLNGAGPTRRRSPSPRRRATRRPRPSRPRSTTPSRTARTWRCCSGGAWSPRPSRSRRPTRPACRRRSDPRMTTSTQHVDHLVVGGGVMGSAAAWQLARRGRDVVLLERFAPGHAHGASHGTSRIYRTTYAEPEYLDLAQEALRLWREIEDETGTALLDVTGGVSHGRRDGAAERRADAIGAAFAARGSSTSGSTRGRGRTLAGAAVRGPGAARGRDGRPAPRRPRRRGPPGAAAARGRRRPARGRRPARRARTRGCARRHRRRRRRRAGRRRDRRGVERGSARLPGGRPAGAGAPARRHAGAARPLRARPGTSPAGWPAFTHDVGPGTAWPSGVYGLATPGEGVKVGFHGVGPVVDPDRRSYRPEPGQLAALRDYVSTWLPGLDPDAYVPVSCTYTTTPDHDFVLDRRGPVVVGAGFSGHGFKFAPAVGRVLADLATAPGALPDGGTAAARFALARLAALPERTAS